MKSQKLPRIIGEFNGIKMIEVQPTDTGLATLEIMKLQRKYPKAFKSKMIKMDNGYRRVWWIK